MCTVSSNWKIAEQDILAYKAVSCSRTSQWHPDKRGVVNGYFEDKGQNLEYIPGRMVVSPSGPGIMVYPLLSDAEESVKEMMFVLPNSRAITVLIPAGTRIRTGEHDDRQLLTAEVVKVLD